MNTMRESNASTACMEHQIFEHIKQALLVTLNWQAPAVSMPRKLSSLQFTMKSFQRHFERVMSIEEDGGFMAESVEMKPHLQDRVDQLEADHACIRERIGRIVVELDDIKEWEEPRFEQVCCGLRSLIGDVDRHNAAEIELLQESMLAEEGGEG
ncbi:MAG: hemerythrin domain-containing protein [Pirellulales bacterium]